MVRTVDPGVSRRSPFELADYPQSSRLRGLREFTTSRRGQLALALGVAIVLRIVMLVRAQGMLEGDEAVLGIQAEDILRGAHPIYFYGQPYMASFEAYLLAPLQAVVGPSGTLMHVVTLSESLLLIPLLGALATKLYGRRARVPALLVAAVPPLYVAAGELHMLGGYVETLVLGTGLLLVAVTIAERWAQGRRTVWLWLVFGLCTGLALWIDLLIAYYLVACALWLAPVAVARLRVSEKGSVLWRHIGVGIGASLAGGLVGATPALIYAFSNNFSNVTGISAPEGAFAAAHPLRLGVARILVTSAVPRVAGFVTVWDASRLAHIVNSALGILLAVITLAAVAHTARELVRGLPSRGKWLSLNARETQRFWHYALAPLLACVIVVVFWRSNATGNIPLDTGVDISGRYTLPLTTALSLMLSALICGLQRSRVIRAHVGMWAEMLRGHGIRGAGLVVLALLLLCCAVPYFDSDTGAALQSPYKVGLSFPAAHSDLLTYVEQHHIHTIWANHWIGNVVMYLEDERVLCADYVDVQLSGGHNRFPQAYAIVSASDRPSFLLESNPAHGEPTTARALDMLGVAYESAHFGSLWIITPLSRTVQPAEIAAALTHDY